MLNLQKNRTFNRSTLPLWRCCVKTLLDAQQTTRTARLSLVETKQSQYNAYVTLMQALGGSPVKELPQ